MRTKLRESELRVHRADFFAPRLKKNPCAMLRRRSAPVSGGLQIDIFFFFLRIYRNLPFLDTTKSRYKTKNAASAFVSIRETAAPTSRHPSFYLSLSAQDGLPASESASAADGRPEDTQKRCGQKKIAPTLWKESKIDDRKFRAPLRASAARMLAQSRPAATTGASG